MKGYEELMREFTGLETTKLRRTAHLRVNVGCGEYPMNFWTNLDGDPEVPAQVHAVVPPMPFDDEELEHIYVGHLLEHLTFVDGAEFLAECYRCLKPGGRLGVVVPDTREILTRWFNQMGDEIEVPQYTWWNVNDLDDICHLFLYSDVQDSLHHWSYDASTLARAMTVAGFENLTEIHRYGDIRLASGAWYQCGWDGYKPSERTKEDGKDE